MFVNCPYCRTLVATDPATDRPPAHCPDCLGPLRAGPAANLPLVGDEAGNGLDPPGIDPTGAEVGDAEVGDTHESVPVEVAAAGDAAPVEDTPVEDTHRIGDSLVGETRSPSPIGDTHSAVGNTRATAGASLPAAAPMAAIANAPEPAEPAEAAPVPVAAHPGYGRRAGSRSAAPSFARQRAATPRSGRRWPEAAAVAALTLLLGLQCLLADRARLAADARWRSVLEPLCAALGCDLPPWREPTAFVLLQRDVRQHPNLPGTLRVTASFRNDARWAQPWPQLELTLSDANGRPAGRRRFPAADYLGGSPTQTMLASGDTASVTMDILEPAPQIVAYDFRFR